MDLYEKIQARPLVAVVGASGSGKSSLVFAGLQPRLKAEGWLVEDCRPGTQPFYGLAEAFIRLLESDLAGSQLVKQASDLSELIQQRGIGEVVASLTHKYAGRSLLIVIDQFEELFTLCERKQRESFLKTVLDELMKAVGLKLIVTLRADFCGQAYGDRTLTDAFQDAQLLVGPMKD
jgi:energy-coupling factor transporter ATP-binding protein EcfA2